MPTIAPPDVPAGIDPKMADYLRRLLLWLNREMNRRTPDLEAQPNLLVSSSDEKSPVHLWSITVNSAGAMSITAVPLGGGKP